MRFGQFKDALVHTAGDLNRNHTLQMATALSYYFVMSLFPALVLLSQKASKYALLKEEGSNVRQKFEERLASIVG